MTSSDEEKNNPAKIIEKFDDYVIGETKEFFERFKFNHYNQTSETFDQYLRNMDKSCGFGDCMREKLIMDRIVFGIN